MEQRLLYTIPHTCDITGWSRTFLYGLIRSGRLPVVRVGRSVRIAAEDLQRFVAEHKVGA